MPDTPMPMPVFVIKAKDKLALGTLIEYQKLCLTNGPVRPEGSSVVTAPPVPSALMREAMRWTNRDGVNIACGWIASGWLAGYEQGRLDAIAEYHARFGYVPAQPPDRDGVGLAGSDQIPPPRAAAADRTARAVGPGVGTTKHHDAGGYT